MNRYFSLPLTLCVSLFIGCGGIDDNQPARLISTDPAEGGRFYHFSVIHLRFDKAVTDVRVNGAAAQNRQSKSSAVAWEIAANKLDIRPPGFGDHPEVLQELLVELNITFEDDTGRHHAKLNVWRVTYIGHGEPPKITGGNVTNGAEDIDPKLLNDTDGILITFDEPVQAGTVVLRPKDGAPLNWRVEWEGSSVSLYPSNGDKLQYETEYIIELIGVKDVAGNKANFEIRFTTKGDK